jgi:hypothetical protein
MERLTRIIQIGQNMIPRGLTGRQEDQSKRKDYQNEAKVRAKLLLEVVH